MPAAGEAAKTRNSVWHCAAVDRFRLVTPRRVAHYFTLYADPSNFRQ